ncbi:MAG: FolC bifunctional protein [Parcubacteria group bacterium GW2011_GWA2_44_12]|nr:MAG: FolC bifunctional protein [Parcubacteria group bacterium GW2011_GWA2_44_12]
MNLFHNTNQSAGFHKTVQKYRKSVDFLLSLQNMSDGRDYMCRDQNTNPSMYLKRTKYLMNLLENPQDDLKIIHVGGTSGKGTCVNELHEILKSAGFRVGSFTKPHPTTTIERIKVGAKLIAPEEFSHLVEYLKPALTICAEKSPYGVPSFLETLTALAFLYFKKQKCEYVVLEVGCGGNYDATNVIKKSVVSAITEIGFDHTDILGDTLAKIAREKLGIVKKNGVLFTRERRKTLLKQFQAHCKKRSARLIAIPHDASLSQAIAQYLGIEQKYIQAGRLAAFLPCHFEIIQKNPLVILDGAHNPDKIQWLIQKFEKEVRTQRPSQKIWLIFGAGANKDWKNMARKILPLADAIILTRHSVCERMSASLRNLKKIAIKVSSHTKCEVCIDPKDALAHALKNAKKDDILLATGSLYMVGALRERWMSEEEILFKRSNAIRGSYANGNPKFY